MGFFPDVTREHVGAIPYLISYLAKHVYGHDPAIRGGCMVSS